MFDYNLFVECGLTPNGHLVDLLPYSYEWVDDVHEFCFGELLKGSLDITSFIVLGVVVFRALIRGRSWIFTLRLCIDDDMSCMMTWLLGELFYHG
jgi:hypothetical protein